MRLFVRLREAALYCRTIRCAVKQCRASILLTGIFPIARCIKSFPARNFPRSSPILPGRSALPEAIYERIGHYERLYREHASASKPNRPASGFRQPLGTSDEDPLSVIQLTLDEVEEAPAEHIREELDRIRKGLECAVHRAPTGLSRILQKPPCSVVSESVVENRKLFIRKGITPVFQIDDRISVYTDAKWFRFMLGQILTNAVNYSGTPARRFINRRSAGKHIKLYIGDEGIGIAPEDINRVFHPYFTGERGRQYHESTGMGLYLVREITHKLDHSVELESKLGEGTTVTLTMRRAENQDTSGP